MRLILLAAVVCAGTLAADPSRTAEREAMNDVRSRPQAAKGKRAFHPLRLLRGLGKAESEFGLRLSSWGIQRDVEAVRSDSARSSPLTETSVTGNAMIKAVGFGRPRFRCLMTTFYPDTSGEDLNSEVLVLCLQ